MIEYIFCRIKFKRMFGQLKRKVSWYDMCRHQGTCVWYTLTLLFTKKVKKDRGHYFSPLSSIRVIALVRKISYELHRKPVHS